MSYDQIVNHPEREMELNDLGADEPLVKTQMAGTKKKQRTENSNKKQSEKSNRQTPRTVPYVTLIMTNAATVRGDWSYDD